MGAEAEFDRETGRLKVKPAGRPVAGNEPAATVAQEPTQVERQEED